MTQFTKEKLKEKQDKLFETYLALKQLQNLSLSDIQSKKENFWAVNYGLVIAVEAVLDIGQYVLSDKNIKTVSYSQIIPALAKENILPEEFAREIQGMVNFRNIAIHAYPALNEELVYKFLQEKIDDFKKFLELVGVE